MGGGSGEAVGTWNARRSSHFSPPLLSVSISLSFLFLHTTTIYNFCLTIGLDTSATMMRFACLALLLIAGKFQNFYRYFDWNESERVAAQLRSSYIKLVSVQSQYVFWPFFIFFFTSRCCAFFSLQTFRNEVIHFFA